MVDNTVLIPSIIGAVVVALVIVGLLIYCCCCCDTTDTKYSALESGPAEEFLVVPKKINVVKPYEPAARQNPSIPIPIQSSYWQEDECLSLPNNSWISDLKTDADLEDLCVEISPTQRYINISRRVTHQLVTTLHQLPFGYGPQEVYKTGSQKKDTAVEGSDLDLVLFLKTYDFPDVWSVKCRMEEILNVLNNHLRMNGYKDVQIKQPFMVTVRVDFEEFGILPVDILPACFAVCEITDNYVYKQMQYDDEETRPYYSAALAKKQVAFVTDQSQYTVRTLIRLVKYWSKKELASQKDSRFPSYLIELIVIRKWHDADSPHYFQVRPGFYSVLQALANYKALKITWSGMYDTGERSKMPCVMDPGNPFNNVADSCNMWEEVSQKAKNAMKFQLFYNIHGNNSHRINEWNW